MFVLARLIKRIPAAAPSSVQEVQVPTIEEARPSAKTAAEDEVMQVVIKPTEGAEPKEKVRRKRKLGTATAVETNVGNFSGEASSAP
jgi:hypothetical protein